jgi:hypothetical protein
MPPPGWKDLLCTEAWRYLAAHLNEERLHDLQILLGECPHGYGAKLVAEIRTLLPCSPDHAIVLALARLLDQDVQEQSASKEPRDASP